MLNMIEMKRLNILIVDDDKFFLNTLYELLVGSGFRSVLRAKSAELALQVLETQPVDLILTDVEMEGMNGLDMLKLIRTGATPVRSSLPVVVVTGHSRLSVLGNAIALDANGFLAKPVSMTSLVEKIKTAVTERTKIRPPIGYQVLHTEQALTEEISEIVKAEHQDVDVAEVIAESETIETNEPEESDAFVMDDGTRGIRLDNLEEGMILANSVRTAKGAILIPVGHALTQANINRLKDVREMLASDTLRIAVIQPKA